MTNNNYYEEDYDETSESTDEENNITEGSETDSELKNSILNKLFNPSLYITEFEHKMNGEVFVKGKWKKVRFALARSDFIAKAGMNMSAIINQNTIIAYFSEESDFYRLLVENLLSFLGSALDEPSISATDFYQIFLMYSNSLEMFARLVVGGHASELVRQILVNVYKELPQKQEQPKFNLFG